MCVWVCVWCKCICVYVPACAMIFCVGHDSVIFPHLVSEEESLGSALHSLVLLVPWILAATPISTLSLSTGVLRFKCTSAFHMGGLQGYNTDHQAWVASTFSPWVLLPALLFFIIFQIFVCPCLFCNLDVLILLFL